MKRFEYFVCYVCYTSVQSLSVRSIYAHIVRRVLLHCLFARFEIYVLEFRALLCPIKSKIWNNYISKIKVQSTTHLQCICIIKNVFKLFFCHITIKYPTNIYLHNFDVSLRPVFLLTLCNNVLLPSLFECIK